MKHDSGWNFFMDISRHCHGNIGWEGGIEGDTAQLRIILRLFIQCNFCVLK